MGYHAINRRSKTAFAIGVSLLLLITILVVHSRTWPHGPGYIQPPAEHAPPFPEHGPKPPLPQDPDQFGPSPDEFLAPRYERFTPQKLSFVGQNQRGRYDTVDVWRGDNVIPDSDLPNVKRPNFRPFQPPVSSYSSAGEYLKQTLVADYAGPLTEKVFFMLKTGATVMWERMPLHLATTLTRVKNFALYSDLASSIAGYEVIDILKNMPQHVLEHEQLEMYRILNGFHEQGLGGEVGDLNLENKGWDLDKFKNIPMLVHAYETSPESEWFIFMDDDSYLFWSNIEIALSELDYKEPLYLGSYAPLGLTINDELVEGFGHGGSGVIISKGAMDLVFGPGANRTHQEIIDYYSDMTLYHCCGDMVVAFMLVEEAGVRLSIDDPRWPWRRIQGEATYNVRWRKEMWCEPLLSFHHVSPHEIEYLWEYERLKYKGNYILSADLYHDWVQPYIVEEKSNWRLWEFDRDEHRQFEPEEEMEDENGTYVPTESVANCKRACHGDKDCMAWSHADEFCGLQRTLFRRGLGCTPMHHSWPGSTPTSGWMIDRIRQWRGAATCDLLEDDAEYSEGWFLRAKKRERAATYESSEGTKPGE